MSSFATVLTRLGLDEHSPLLASGIAQDLVSGARTIAIHDYALPDWCKDVDIAVVEKKGDDAGVIVGVVRFGEDIDYASDDASFTRDAALHGAPENLGRGWVVRAARRCELCTTKLKCKYRDFFEAVADAEGPSFVILHPIYGKIASVAVDHIIKRLPALPVPSGAKQGCLGASVPAVLAACPLNVVKASAVCAEGVFKAADGVATAPISRADLMKGFLVHSDEDGKPIATGGPLRLAFPENVAVQSAICGTPKPPDLKNCVSLELRDDEARN